MAKQHFCHYIKAGSTNPKVNQWDLFISKLETVFGDPDWIGEASDKILGLKMKETSWVHSLQGGCQQTQLARECSSSTLLQQPSKLYQGPLGQIWSAFCLWQSHLQGSMHWQLLLEACGWKKEIWCGSEMSLRPKINLQIIEQYPTIKIPQ